MAFFPAYSVYLHSYFFKLDGTLDANGQKHATTFIFTTSKYKKNRSTLSVKRFSYGTPGGIRTPDPLVRSQILYPAELLAHIFEIY